MNILFVSPRQCWPVLSGAKLREYHLARALGRQFTMTYVFFSEPGQPVPTLADLPFCKDLVAVRAPDRYSVHRIVRGVLGRWPLPIENYTSGEMTSTIDALVARNAFDLVHLDGVHLAAYVAHLYESTPRLRIAVDWHNIESEGMRRYAGKSPSGPKRIYAAITSRRLAVVEQMLLQRAFGNLVCSERERRQLLSLAPPGARVAVIENGVDVSHFDSQNQHGERPRNRIVFVGAMDYHPNIDAVLTFARRVWPALHLAFPEWRFTIVGSKPAPSVRALSREPGIEVTGSVADVRPYYSEAFASIVPLRTGGGTRLKILEAMAAGVPVLSTSIGAEGLAVTPGENILITDRDEDWRPALASLADPARRSYLAQAARNLVRSRYDWEILGEMTRRMYQEWVRK
jgi:sugar transferase (PEP-CTERM/EpsH1 system associated)